MNLHNLYGYHFQANKKTNYRFNSYYLTKIAPNNYPTENQRLISFILKTSRVLFYNLKPNNKLMVLSMLFYHDFIELMLDNFG
jgi:hypothetical protein